MLTHRLVCFGANFANKPQFRVKTLGEGDDFIKRKLYTGEHHPNCEVRRWQYYVVWVFPAGKAGNLNLNIMQKYQSNISRHEPGS